MGYVAATAARLPEPMRDCEHSRECFSRLGVGGGGRERENVSPGGEGTMWPLRPHGPWKGQASEPTECRSQAASHEQERENVFVPLGLY